MPEMHINGRSSSHNASLEIDNFGISYATCTSPGSLVTADSYISTIAINTPTNTMDHHTSLYGVVPLFLFFGLMALVIMIATVVFLAKKDREQNLKENTEPNHHLKFLPPPNVI